MARSRKSVPLRLDPAVYEAIARWAHDDLRSVNAHIEVMLREQLRQAGRLPKNAGEIPKPGRPPKKAADDTVGGLGAPSRPGATSRDGED